MGFSRMRSGSKGAYALFLSRQVPQLKLVHIWSASSTQIPRSGFNNKTGSTVGHTRPMLIVLWYTSIFAVILQFTQPNCALSEPRKVFVWCVIWLPVARSTTSESAQTLTRAVVRGFVSLSLHERLKPSSAGSEWVWVHFFCYIHYQVCVVTQKETLVQGLKNGRVDHFAIVKFPVLHVCTCTQRMRSHHFINTYIPNEHKRHFNFVSLKFKLKDERDCHSKAKKHK